MSEQKDEENPLLTEGQYSGKVFWLNTPDGYTLDLESLNEQLQDRTFQQDISDSFDDDATLHIPEVFKKDGEIVSTTSIKDSKLVNSDKGELIVGTIVLDNTNKVKYRNDEILILDTTEAKFLILEHDQHFYLAVLAKREVAEGIVAILQSEYDQFGSTINLTRIGPDAIVKVRESLDAELMDTIISDYPQKEISSIQIKGRKLEDEEEYERQKRRGKIKTHMFQTEELSPEGSKTVSISRDGLIRIYSNASVSTYLRLLNEHILPHIHRDVESSPSVSAYDSLSISDDNPIYRKESKGD